MPYPSKTDRESILAAAIRQLETDGLAALSLRGLAASLELAPTALYRYFADRATLEEALRDESGNRLHAALVRSVRDKGPEGSIRAMATAYLRFASEHPHLFAMMARPHAVHAAKDAPPNALWTFVIEQVGRVASRAEAPRAAVALWAFLQGIAAIESAQLFGEHKPSNAFEFGVDAWLRAAARTTKEKKK